MRTSHLASFAILALALAFSLTPPTPAADDGRRTLEGDYEWNGGSQGPLTAVFTPDGESRWRVSFRFRHGGGSYEWEGTAEGRLDRGVLSGRVEDSRSRRVFTFEGDFDADGRFEGRHAEVHGRRESSTGTLRLRS